MFYNASGSRGADAVVISGVAGHFPDTDSVAHFGEQLFNKVELVSSEERRWKKFGTENPRRAGTLNNLNKFDASFFGIDYREAHVMNPASRLLLERCYEALIDAGTARAPTNTSEVPSKWFPS
ncbi:fatty acid synthase-like [Battus philenor]|uniref:fatty acid synthase-like n=1 Tax=Battus philenor TaxID=42288 RepID=UPI0035D0B18A